DRAGLRPACLLDAHDHGSTRQRFGHTWRGCCGAVRGSILHRALAARPCATEKGGGSLMRILVTGAAGMIGRKLTERLARDGTLRGQRITAMTLHDIVEPPAPATSGVDMEVQASDLARPGVAQALAEARPDVVFHLAGIVSGEAEANFE